MVVAWVFLSGAGSHLRGSLLSPSGGPTQAETTPYVTFRAVLAEEHVDLGVSL